MEIKNKYDFTILWLKALSDNKQGQNYLINLLNVENFTDFFQQNPSKLEKALWAVDMNTECQNLILTYALNNFVIKPGDINVRQLIELLCASKKNNEGQEMILHYFLKEENIIDYLDQENIIDLLAATAYNNDAQNIIINKFLIDQDSHLLEYFSENIEYYLESILNILNHNPDQQNFLLTCLKGFLNDYLDVEEL